MGELAGIPPPTGVARPPGADATPAAPSLLAPAGKSRPTRRPGRRVWRRARWTLPPLVWVLALWRLSHPDPYPQIALPAPLPCIEGQDPQLTILAIDDSGSTAESDPRGRRYPESLQFAEWLADGGACHSDDLLAVVHFADTASPPLLHRPSDRGSPLGLDGPDPRVGGGTEIAAAVDVASALASQHAGHRTRLLLATDGLLPDYGPALASVAQFPGAVSVIGLGGGLPEPWDAADLDEVIRLDRFTELGAIARQLIDTWNHDTRGASTP